MARRIFVVDDGPFASLPSVTRTATLTELGHAFDFVGQIPKEQPITVQPTVPSAFPEALDLSDAVVRLTNDEILDALIRLIIRDQLKIVIAGIQASGSKTTGGTGLAQPDPRPEALGISNSLKTASGGFAICVMSSLVTLPGTAGFFVKETTQTTDQIKAHRVDIDTDTGKLARYFSHAQSLTDAHDEIIKEHPKKPSEWPTDAQQRYGVYLGQSMAHEARHLFIPAHADSGLGIEGADPLNIKDQRTFSKQDQGDIVKALHALESMQSGKHLIPLFPKSIRENPSSFPF